MLQYYVCRAYVKWKGTLYHKGDVFPDTFTHHDKARSIYNSRIGVREIPDKMPELSKAKEIPKVSEVAAPLSGFKKVEEAPAAKPAAPLFTKGISGADKKTTSSTNPTGTPHK